MFTELLMSADVDSTCGASCLLGPTRNEEAVEGDSGGGYVEWIPLGMSQLGEEDLSEERA